MAWLLWIYDDVANFAHLRLGAALDHAQRILTFEQLLHLAPELDLNRWLVAHRTLGLIVSDYYDNAHFIVPLTLLAYLWWRRPDIYRPLRDSLVLINLIALIVFWRYPVAPPRLLAGSGFTDVASATQAFGSWHTGALATHANQLAAMPSLHVAWASWCAVAIWRMSGRSWARALAFVHPLLTTYAVLATANHFLADVLAGALTAALAVLIVDRTPRRRPLRRADHRQPHPEARSSPQNLRC